MTGRPIRKDVIIIGAGASGLMCAAEAAKRGRTVALLDHGGSAGNKIRISGGGRCNFTNLSADHGKYVSDNPDFCRSALARYSPSDFISLLKSHGIGIHEEDEGRMFCDRTSRDVLHLLERQCASSGVEQLLNCRIARIEKNELFYIATSKGSIAADSLVIATGGRSYPALGASPFGYSVARNFGLRTVPQRPGLVPLLWSKRDAEVFGKLSGISVFSKIKINNHIIRGNVLFTHNGLSGPAILQASLYWKKGDVLAVDLLPDREAMDLFMRNRQRKIEGHNLLAMFMPARFVRIWLDAVSMPMKPFSNYSSEEISYLAGMLHAWIIRPAGTEGYSKAEVTLGGVDTNELSSKTFETKKVKGLYFIGEVLDVTGHLGGYNLQWAWSSGYCAGQYV